MTLSDFPRTPPRFSATFTPAINAEIRRAAATGIYDIRGGGTKRHLPHFDDLLFLWARRSAAIRWKATARNAPPMSGWAPGLPKSRSIWKFPSPLPA